MQARLLFRDATAAVDDAGALVRIGAAYGRADRRGDAEPYLARPIAAAPDSTDVA